MRCECIHACRTGTPEDFDLSGTEGESGGEPGDFLRSTIPSFMPALKAGVDKLLCLIVLVAGISLITRPLVICLVEIGLHVAPSGEYLDQGYLSIHRDGRATVATGVLLSIHLLAAVLTATFLLAFPLFVLVFAAASHLIRLLAVVLAVTTVLIL
ncbi:hypothetical protein AN958_02165 [Leucoagaricus sp. SymC.cos]|nr:hypothetical protein AN958_02165 [Leucoagaricus sp. SymC.cos]